MSDPLSRRTADHVPEPVALVAELMSAFPAHWALCGGWAIDAWLGRQTRDHLDVDICVFIQDQQALFDHLAGWQLVAHGPNASANTNEPWDGRRLDLPVHIHGRLDACEPPPSGILTPEQGFSLDVQLSDRSGRDWILSSTAAWEWPAAARTRQPCVRVPLRNGVQQSPWGLPTVVPKVLLFFKATAYFGIEEQMTGGRVQDEPDFIALLPHLTEEQRHWLRESIALHHPDHPWLSQLPP
ncbi:MAG: hypothetical protein WD379_10005 [Dehalococcoidia bacterium]